MTDTRWPEHWLTDPVMDALSDPAYRVFGNGLMWSVRAGTDGAIPGRALRFLHPDAGLAGRAAAELVACGRWTTTADGWVILGFLDHQSSAAEIEDARAEARDKKRRQRAGVEKQHVRGDHSGCTTENCSTLRPEGRPPGRAEGRPPGVPEDRTGQDSTKGDQLQTYAARASDTRDGRSALSRALAASPVPPTPNSRRSA